MLVFLFVTPCEHARTTGVTPKSRTTSGGHAQHNGPGCGLPHPTSYWDGIRPLGKQARTLPLGRMAAATGMIGKGTTSDHAPFERPVRGVAGFHAAGAVT